MIYIYDIYDIQDRAGQLCHDPRHKFDLDKDQAWLWTSLRNNGRRVEKGTERHRAMGILSLAGVRLQGVRPLLVAIPMFKCVILDLLA